MSALSAELDRYLEIRRGLGHQLRTDEGMLRRFVAFAEAEGEAYVSHRALPPLAGELRRGEPPDLGAPPDDGQDLRPLAARLDPRHEVPPHDLIPSSNRRPRPYIYREDEIRRIVAAAADLPSANGLRGLTYPVLFGLIAVTGLRVTEAISLGAEDVDLEAGVITVRHGKLGTERLLPLDETTRARLRAYVKERDRLLGQRPQTFFVADTGAPIGDCAARYNFAVVCRAVGLRPAQRYNRHGRGPRIHDLRHTFAVRTLVN